MSETRSLRVEARIKQAVLVSLCGVLLAGCQSTAMRATPASYASRPGNAALSTSEQELADALSRERMAQGGMTGCVAGAGVGAAIGHLATDGSGQGTLIGLGAGCLAGALIGTAYGSYADSQAKQYASRNDAYKAAIEGAEKDLRRSRERNAKFRAIVSERKRQIASMKDRLRANKITAQEARADLGSAQGTVDLLRSQAAQYTSQINEMDKGLAQYRSDGLSVAELDSRRNALVKERDQLLSAANDLVGTYKTLPADAQPAVS